MKVRNNENPHWNKKTSLKTPLEKKKKDPISGHLFQAVLDNAFKFQIHQ